MCNVTYSPNDVIYSLNNVTKQIQAERESIKEGPHKLPMNV